MAPKKPKELSWEPVADGAIYCAPACGFKCTRAAYDHAVAEADKLVKRLGPGWKPRVWENLGWHHAARHDAAEADVHVNRDGSFWANHARGSGEGVTPQRAVAALVAKLHAEYAAIGACIDALMGGTPEELAKALAAAGEPS